MYSNIPSIDIIAQIADIVVFGDMFNYTGKLYAYDEISKKIGGTPLFYSEIKPLMEKGFRDHYMFDLRAQQVLEYPNAYNLLSFFIINQRSGEIALYQFHVLSLE